MPDYPRLLTRFAEAAARSRWGKAAAVAGEESAAARAAAKRAARRAAVLERPQALEVLGPEGAVERRVPLPGSPATTFSPEATARQAARVEALQRQEVGPQVRPGRMRSLVTGDSLLDAFEREYGWRPESNAKARELLGAASGPETKTAQELLDKFEAPYSGGPFKPPEE